MHQISLRLSYSVRHIFEPLKHQLITDNKMHYTLHRGDRKLKLKIEQLTTKSIGQVFRVFPDSIVLIADEDGSVETSDEHGHFSALRSYLSYEVHGDSLVSGSSAHDGASSYSLRLPGTSSSSTPTPITHTVPTLPAPARSITIRGISKKTRPAKPPGVTMKESCQWTKSIEVIHLSNGVLEKFSNFPILLNESSASISHISQQLSHEVFGGKDVILLDNDNLPVPDTTASRGELSNISLSLYIVVVVW